MLCFAALFVASLRYVDCRWHWRLLESRFAEVLHAQVVTKQHSTDSLVQDLLLKAFGRNSWLTSFRQRQRGP